MFRQKCSADRSAGDTCSNGFRGGDHLQLCLAALPLCLNGGRPAGMLGTLQRQLSAQCPGGRHLSEQLLLVCPALLQRCRQLIDRLTWPLGASAEACEGVPCCLCRAQRLLSAAHLRFWC